MPRAAKGPRLWQERREGRSPVWIIRDDGGVKISTGTESRREAEKALERYIAGKHRPSGPADPTVLTCGQALEHYAEDMGGDMASPERAAYAIQALDPFWGDLTVSDISGPTCRRYMAHRGVSESTVRRELGVLRAAIKYCAKEGYLTSAPEVWIPAEGAPKDRWLTRQEAAYLIRGARSLRMDGRHLQWFIVLALYTGGRKAALLAAEISTQPVMHAGRLDPVTGLFTRRGRLEKATKKERNPCRMPRQLLAHVKRKARLGHRFFVQDHQGNQIGDIRKGWANAIVKAREIAEADGVEIDLSDVTPHTLKHTACTWSMQRRADLYEAAAYFSTSVATFTKVYAHHHPDFQQSAVRAMETK